MLSENRTLLPELLVEPEGLDSETAAARQKPADTDDPLLQLFYGESLTPEAFHEAMRKQRAVPPAASNGAAAGASA